jgi:hypothetical protein
MLGTAGIHHTPYPNQRRAGKHLVTEEFGAGPEHVGQKPLQQPLKALPVTRRDAVPCLWSSIMQVIHTGQIHVFCVPAERQKDSRWTT